MRSFYNLMLCEECAIFCCFYLLDRKGFYEEAVVLLNKAIKEEKNETSLYINRGGLVKRGVASLWERLETSGLYTLHTYYPLVSLLCTFAVTDAFCRKGELHFALLDYQQARDMGGARWDICYRLAVVHHILGKQAYGRSDFSSAERHFTQAINHSPHTSSFYYCRAQTKHVRKVCVYVCVLCDGNSNME